MRYPLITMLVALLMTAGTAVHAQTPQAGEQYRVIDQPQPTSTEDGRVQVLEFFSYGCPACFDFRNKEEAWRESLAGEIDFQRVPVSFNRDSWALLARAYYVSQVLNALDKTHEATYQAIHLQGRNFSSPEEIADFYATLGLDRQKVLDAFDSFAVEMKMRRGERLVRTYAVPGTPSMAVAGRYAIDVRGAGGQDEMLAVARYLVEREG
jgi:thiol:disulfide interchange protein DsbA